MRVPSLDYLRGLMALSVMAFHYQKWTTGEWDAASLLGKLGVYAVATFFVLSGLTLGLAYRNAPLDTRAGLWLFLKKRVGRIFPLLWLATLSTFLLDRNLGLWHLTDLFLNLTGLFGFLATGRDIALGAWSLGCELVFYAAFPVLWLFGKRKLAWAWLLVAAGSVGAAVFFSYSIMEEDTPLANQWAAYVNPAQHFFLFAAGAGLAFFWGKLAAIPPRVWTAGLVLTVAAFALWPIDGGPPMLMFEADRLVLSFLSILLTASAFGSGLRFSGKTDGVLTWLADCSYTIYLLHPLVLRGLNWANERSAHLPKIAVAALATGLTFWASHVVFQKFEVPIKRRIVAIEPKQNLSGG